MPARLDNLLLRHFNIPRHTPENVRDDIRVQGIFASQPPKDGGPISSSLVIAIPVYFSEIVNHRILFRDQ